MTECVICRQKAGIFSHRIYNGKLCRKCRAYLPMRIDLSACDTDYVISLIERSRKYADNFNCTASYGSLYIDSVHSLLCFSKGDRKGSPASYGDIFSITDIREMGLYCTDVRNTGTKTNHIVCNIKMRIVTDSVNIEYIVKQNESCSCTTGKNGSLQWREPDKLSMFRNMINQMIRDTMDSILKQLETIQKAKAKLSEYEIDKEWAKGVLFLENKEYSIDEIKSRYRSMMKIFHPDLHPELEDSYAQTLNKAYKTLNPK